MTMSGKDARNLCRYGKGIPTDELSGAARQTMNKKLAISGLLEGIRDATSSEIRAKNMREFARELRECKEARELASDELISFRVVGFIVDPMRNMASPAELDAAFSATLSWINAGASLTRIKASLVSSAILHCMPPLGSGQAEIKASGIHIIDGILGTHPDMMAIQRYGHLFGYMRSQHPQVVGKSLDLVSTHVLLNRPVPKNVMEHITGLKKHGNEYIRTSAAGIIDMVAPDKLD